MERRTAAVPRARLRSRASRFSCAGDVAAVFRHGAFEFAWSVPFLARFFHKYIPCRCARPTARAHTTDRKRNGKGRLIMPAGKDSGSIKGDAVSITRVPEVTPQGWWGFCLTRVRSAGRDVQAAAATPGPSRGHPIGPRAGYFRSARSKILCRTATAWRHCCGWMRSR